MAAVWLGIAHAVGSAARGIGHTARDLDPEHRRDGVGLFLFGLAIVIAAAVWFEAPGGVLEFTRTVVAGSVGKVGWLVPLVVVLGGWRVMRDPVRNGPAGRQVIGWSAFCFGVLGIVHIANGSPQPVSGDTTPLREGGGAVGFVVSSLLLDLLRSEHVVVPLLVLLAFFGVLVITATPLYQVPERLAAARDRALGRHRDDANADDEDTQPIKRRRRSDPDLDGLELGDPAYDTPVLEDRERRKRKRAAEPPAEEDAAAAEPSPDATRPASSSRRRTRRSRSGSSSSRCPATSPTRCRPTTCSSPARRTRRGPRPATRWSTGSPRCSRSSASTPR